MRELHLYGNQLTGTTAPTTESLTGCRGTAQCGQAGDVITAVTAGGVLHFFLSFVFHSCGCAEAFVSSPLTYFDYCSVRFVNFRSCFLFSEFCSWCCPECACFDCCISCPVILLNCHLCLRGFVTMTMNNAHDFKWPVGVGVVLSMRALIVGPIPTQVGQLEKLSTLQLDNNQLTGKNTVTDVGVGREMRSGLSFNVVLLSHPSPSGQA